MIHRVESGDYVISSRGSWLPGVYADERTARYAFQFPNRDLQALSDRVCRVDRENRSITSQDLRQLRRKSDGADHD